MTPIQRLANAVGFHDCYTNSFGEEVYATDDSRIALLKAMGYEVTDDDEIEKHIQQLTNSEWLTLIPNTHILAAEVAKFSISVTIPSVLEECILNWKIVQENGESLTGNQSFNKLKKIAGNSLNKINYNQYSLPLPDLDEGYHNLEASIETDIIENNNTSDSNIINSFQSAYCHLIVAPKTCYGPKDAANYKMWGLAAQLYSLKSESSWGIGDFGDLENLVKGAADKGASCIGLNPLHPLFPGNPAHRSPYSPTSRNFLNTIYINVKQVPNFEQCEAAIKLVQSEQFQQQLKNNNSQEIIDYSTSAGLKYQVLELLYLHFQKHHLSQKTALANEYQLFVKKFGSELHTLATFDALYEYFRKSNNEAYGWTSWPKNYQDPNSKQVKLFQQENPIRIGYFQFIQWIADRQLQHVSDTAKNEGMAIGLYLDLAVGSDGGGSDVWANRKLYVAGGSVGAPPDLTNFLGQDWGLTPINPLELKRQGFKPFAAALRDNMKHAGALRIDHVLGYMRQYWVAPGKKANEGIYISFPFEDMLRIIALESRRAKCIVIGEDLGTTPEGFGEIMASAGLLSYRVLFFERWENGLFQRPENYPEQSMVTVSTHDLPTLAGWWTGNDLAWREKLSLYPTEEMGDADRNNRVTDREQLLSAMYDMNLLEQQNAPSMAPATMNSNLSVAVQGFLSKAPSRIHLVPLEDALGMQEQVNIPGTIDEHPNWLQRLPLPMEEIWQQGDMQNLVETMHKERHNS